MYACTWGMCMHTRRVVPTKKQRYLGDGKVLAEWSLQQIERLDGN